MEQTLRLRPLSVLTVAHLAYLAKTADVEKRLNRYTPEFQDLIRNAENHRDLPVEIVEGHDYVHQNYVAGKGGRSEWLEDLADREIMRSPNGISKVKTLGDVLDQCQLKYS